MEIQKIKIEREIVDVDKNKPYSELVVGEPPIAIKEEELDFYKTTAIRIPYKIISFVDKDDKIREYLVRDDDMEILEIFLSTGQKIKNIILDAKENCVKNEIKSLPFYKRLFNLF